MYLTAAVFVFHAYLDVVYELVGDDAAELFKTNVRISALLFQLMPCKLPDLLGDSLAQMLGIRRFEAVFCMYALFHHAHSFP